MDARVWAVVLNFRGAEMTIACARSLLACGEQPHVLVVDNGSGGDDLGRLQHAFEGVDDIELAETGTNLGYAGGMQWGVRTALEANAEFIWLVNNDCVAEPGSLTPLLREMADHPETAACSGVVLHPRESTASMNAGANLDLVWGRVRPRESRADLLDTLPERYEVDLVAGHAWMLRASVVQQVGGLDCRLFAQGEEPDWCFRARRAGYRCVVVRSSVVHALASATMRRYPCEQLYFATRNMTWLVRRQSSPLRRLAHHGLFLAYRLPKAVLGLSVRGRVGCVPWLLRGAADGLASSPAWSDDPLAALGSRPPSMA